MSSRTLLRLAVGLTLAGLVLLLVYALVERRVPEVVPVASGLRGLEVVTADRIDSLAALGAEVSVTGTVVEEGDARTPLLLDDGTGLVAVRLPEATTGPLTGQRLFARGPLVERDGQVVLEAVEWLYDSTAVRVHSE